LIATFASVMSLFVTAQADLPIGAAIVCMLGVFLVLSVIASRFLAGRKTRASPI
jgi:ABC-type Mn2+/Zn2+ transport system permease subunit